MSISPVSPLAVKTVSSHAGAYSVETSIPHGIVGVDTAVSISGCRDASGVLMTALNGTHTAIVLSTTVFYFASTYAAGYTHSFGGSVWVQSSKVTSATLTGFDSNLTRAVDKTGDTIYGEYTSLVNPAIQVDSGGQVLTEVSGATFGTTPYGTFGNIVLGDNDDIQLVPARSRSIMISPLESLTNYQPVSLYSNLATSLSSSDLYPFGAEQYYDPTTNQGAQIFWIPLTRIHDKSTLVSATLYFFSTLQAGLTIPSVFPTIQIFRINPSTSTSLTSLSDAGAAAFTLPTASTSAYQYTVTVNSGTLFQGSPTVTYSSATTTTTAGGLAAYIQTPAIGASGGLLLSTGNGGSATVSTNSILTDSSGNVFQTTTSGTYANGASINVQAIAPASPAVFYGSNTNHSSGDILTWVSAPINCNQTLTVGPDGLTGGLDAGYAQSVTFVPDSDKATIDQTNYVYILKCTTDNAPKVNSLALVPDGPDYASVLTGIKLTFSGITSLAAQ